VDLALLIVSFLVTTAALTVALPTCLQVYHRFRRSRPMPCPETGEAASVAVSAGLAATSSAFVSPQLRVKGCTLWPVHRDCGRSCLGHLRSSPV
jgi:hypothetical protein